MQNRKEWKKKKLGDSNSLARKYKPPSNSNDFHGTGRLAHRTRRGKFIVRSQWLLPNVGMRTSRPRLSWWLVPILRPLPPLLPRKVLFVQHCQGLLTWCLFFVPKLARGMGHTARRCHGSVLQSPFLFWHFPPPSDYWLLDAQVSEEMQQTAMFKGSWVRGLDAPVNRRVIKCWFFKQIVANDKRSNKFRFLEAF